MAEVERITDEQLSEKLKEILQEWPLYRELRYQGSLSQYLPKEISYFCDDDQCQKVQLWAKVMSGVDRTGWTTESYTCKNCSRNQLRFFYLWWGQGETGLFVKAGQFPPLRREPPERLTKKLSKVDHDLYRKSLTSRNNAYGIGALVYLRRVVENRMNDLLDLLGEAAKQDDTAGEELTALSGIVACRFLSRGELAMWIMAGQACQRPLAL
jgi:hypothetical protein